jgi:hypothetical protein
LVKIAVPYVNVSAVKKELQKCLKKLVLKAAVSTASLE